MALSANSRGLSATTIANTVQHISRHHSSEDPHLSSTESYSTLSDDSSEVDEIVYSISDLSVISAPHTSADEFTSDDDFVLLGRAADSQQRGARSVPSTATTSLSASMIESQMGSSMLGGMSDAFSHLQVEDSDVESERPVSQATTRRRRRGRGPSSSVSVPAQSPASSAAKPSKASTPKKVTTLQTSAAAKPASPKKKKRSKSRKAATTASASAQPPKAVKAGAKATTTAAGSASQAGKRGAVPSGSFYQDAVQYISTFLSTPAQNTKGQSDLTLLQALIIELGLCPATPSEASETSFSSLPSLPRSLRAAKALLKSRVFVNVRDYLDVRHNGLAALQAVMHPNRKALIKDLTRGKGKRKVPRDFVKESGLGVLLVTTYH